MPETASILTIPLLTVHVVVVVRLTLARAGSNDKATMRWAYLCRSTFHHAAHHCLNIRVFSCQMSDYVSTYDEFLRALPYGNFWVVLGVVVVILYLINQNKTRVTNRTEITRDRKIKRMTAKSAYVNDRL